MNKTVKTILCTLCCVLALYGLILLIRKIMLSPDTSRMTKKDLGYSFYLEPFRHYIGKQPDLSKLGPQTFLKPFVELEDPQIIKEKNTKCLQNKWKICSSKGDNLTYDQCMNLNNDSFLQRYQNECKLVQNNVNDFIATDLPDLSNVINL